MRPRAFAKHPNRSAVLKQRLSLIASKAAREIAHGICSFPSVISKSTRLPSQRGSEGDVIQLKNGIAATPPKYVVRIHYDLCRIGQRWPGVPSYTSARPEFI